MTELRDRVLRRFLQAGSVVPFGRPSKPAPHTIEIGGTKYALSDDGGPLGSPDDDNLLGEGAGQARVIRGPSHGKFKYLWVYDTDRQIVAMWRATDGNEKLYDSARSMTGKIVKLDKKGQINRVLNQDFRKIETAMRKREDEHGKALAEWVEREKTAYQREVDRLTLEFFERHVAPQLDRAVQDIDSGVTPLGFKPHNVDLPVRRQMVAFVMSRIMGRDFTPEKVEQYLRQHGIDPDDPGRDNQAAHWAVGDVRDKAYERYL